MGKKQSRESIDNKIKRSGERKNKTEKGRGGRTNRMRQRSKRKKNRGEKDNMDAEISREGGKERIEKFAKRRETKNNDCGEKQATTIIKKSMLA